MTATTAKSHRFSKLLWLKAGRTNNGTNSKKGSRGEVLGDSRCASAIQRFPFAWEITLPLLPDSNPGTLNRSVEANFFAPSGVK
jgi:hypothetical protein